MSELRKIKRALISVSDKSGLHELVHALAGHNVEIISTGGTAEAIRAFGLEVREVSEITGYPEMMGGRLKTLHPKIHGALLALRDDPAHIASMRDHGIEPIDMVVVNLYPFEQTVAKEDVTLDEAIENIDIGGPAMIRSASKNWRDVAVVTDPRLYPEIAAELDARNGSLSIETRQRLATLAYTRTASYDLAISSYLARQLSNEDLERLEPLNPLSGLGFFEMDDEDAADESPDFGSALYADDSRLPLYATIELEKITDLRYGENPHQPAALYSEQGSSLGLVGSKQLQGKEMSFNNYVDADAAWSLVKDMEGTAVAIIKHTNPSGVGKGATVLEAYQRALSTDPVSAFGGIVAFNENVDGAAARAVIEVFSEVIIAPGYDDEALEIFKAKRNLRVLLNEDHLVVYSDGYFIPPELEYKQISGGFLLQEKDQLYSDVGSLEIVTKRKPSDAEMAAMNLAWTVCKHVKSNAIVFADEYQTLGVGAGQMNRVDSVRIAAMRAERFDLRLAGSALASDAFFPFRDSVDEAAKFGVTAIIQPGGSIKDEESIAAANQHGIAMAFTGVRHFRH